MIMLLPWGAQEQHGPMLPAYTDTAIAGYIARKIKEQLGKHEECFLLPALPYGSSAEHDGFPETVSIEYKTALYMLEAILKSIATNNPDAEMVVIINGHGGNQHIASAVCADLNLKCRTKFIVQHVFPEKTRELARSLFGSFSAHADSVEASAIQAIEGGVGEGTYQLQQLGCTSSPRHAMVLFPVREISASGIVAKTPVIIDAQKGKEILEDSVKNICAQIHSHLDTVRQMTKTSV